MLKRESERKNFFLPQRKIPCFSFLLSFYFHIDISKFIPQVHSLWEIKKIPCKGPTLSLSFWLSFYVPLKHCVMQTVDSSHACTEHGSSLEGSQKVEDDSPNRTRYSGSPVLLPDLAHRLASRSSSHLPSDGNPKTRSQVSIISSRASSAAGQNSTNLHSLSTSPPSSPVSARVSCLGNTQSCTRTNPSSLMPLHPSPSIPRPISPADGHRPFGSPRNSCRSPAPESLSGSWTQDPVTMPSSPRSRRRSLSPLHASALKSKSQIVYSSYNDLRIAGDESDYDCGVHSSNQHAVSHMVPSVHGHLEKGGEGWRERRLASRPDQVGNTVDDTHLRRASDILPYATVANNSPPPPAHHLYVPNPLRHSSSLNALHVPSSLSHQPPFTHMMHAAHNPPSLPSPNLHPSSNNASPVLRRKGLASSLLDLADGASRISDVVRRPRQLPNPSALVKSRGSLTPLDNCVLYTSPDLAADMLGRNENATEEG